MKPIFLFIPTIQLSPDLSGIALHIGARGGVVVKALRYKPAGRSFRFPMVSLEFFSDIILPVALWPWGQLSL